ncbi:MAG: hypothetical protein DHS20C05_25530 [Hyphococcus sp.]|nr:MAG: hypothetical protein DHS20C05_25530 [Marinicaulis sp.]
MPRINSLKSSGRTQEAIDLLNSGVSEREAAKKLGVSRATLRGVKPEQKEQATQPNLIMSELNRQAVRIETAIHDAHYAGNLSALSALENSLLKNLKAQSDTLGSDNDGSNEKAALDAQIKSVSTEILRALQPHEEARKAVKDALEPFLKRYQESASR